MKMKRYLTILVLLCTIGTVHGVHFSYYAGGFRANYYAYAENLPYSDGPYILTQNGTTFASVEKKAGGSPQPIGYARNYISSETSNNSIRIQSYSIAEGAADYSYCYAHGQGFTGTGNSQTNEKGVYYRITPDANEHDGDDVMVYYNDIVSISTDEGTTRLYIGGPDTMDHLAITRGQLPPVTTEPVRENEVLRFPNVNVLNSGDSSWFSGVHAFPAKIGDVIGIFAKDYTEVKGWGYLRGSIYSTHTMILTVEPVLSGDLDYDEDVDLYDLAKLANNWLVDIGYEPPPDTTPPTPNPMQWAPGGEPREIPCGSYYCATMTAATATDPSGGVKYKFVCSNSDFSSGGQADCMFNPGNCPEWRVSPTYTVTIGGSGFKYTFKVRAQDFYENKTDWSPALPMN